MFDFPNSPTSGQQVTGPNGAAYRWDGTKWAAVAGSSSLTLPITIAQGGTGAITAPAALTSLGAAPTSALNNAGRNILHNSLFNIQQRGAGPWTGSFTADRWFLQGTTTGGSVSASVAPMTASTAAVFSDEYAKFNWQASVTAGTGANDQIALQQNIEDVRRLSGKTVTVSFWAWCISGTPKIGVELAQVFGSGGSPSAFVSAVPASGAVTISTTPTRYSVTIVLPSVSGKTFGTTVGTDYTGLFFWLSAGSTNAARASNIGLQSATFLFWGIQLEFGSAATQLEKPDPQQDLANCQRFYQAYPQVLINGYAATAQTFFGDNIFSVPMRAVPTTVFAGISYFNASGLVVNLMYNSHMRLSAGITAVGFGYAMADVALTADL
jgi:hypothetical protein